MEFLEIEILLIFVVMVNASKMKGNNTHIADNSTLKHYRVCLYQGKESAENCISGNISSLPLESRIVIWKTVFGDKSGDQHDMQESVTDVVPAEAKYTFHVEAVVSICAAVLFLACLIGMCIYRLRRALKKIWTRNALITIPNIDIEMEPVGHSRFKINNTEDLFDDETRSLENQAFLKHTSSSSSIVEFLELDVSLSNPSSVESLKNPNNNSPSEWQDEGHYSDKDAGKVVQHNKGKRENKVHIQTEDGKNMHAVIKKNETALDHIIMKYDVMHVKSPAGRSNQEEQNDDNEIIPINASNTIQSTNNAVVENTKYNWTKIFFYVARELIDPKAYILFFNILLAQVGCENPDKRISAIEADGKGAVILTIFRILQYWKDGMGSNVNPKHIEDAFIELDWNSQLDAFRRYMRNPPLLDETKEWHEPLNELSTRHQFFGGSHNVLPMISIGEGQIPILPSDSSYQTSEEIIVQRNSNGENTLRCRKVVQSISDKKRCITCNKICCKNSGKFICKPVEQITCSTSALQSATSTSCFVPTPESGYGSSSAAGQSFNESMIPVISGGVSQQGQMLPKMDHTCDTLNGQERTNQRFQMSPKTTNTSSILHEHEKDIQQCQDTQQGQMTPDTSHTKDLLNGDERTAQQIQLSPETSHTNITQTGDDSLIMKVSSKENRKRRVQNVDDKMNTYPVKIKKKTTGSTISMERKLRNAERQNENLVTHLVECIEQIFQSGAPVDQNKYDIFINDLLARLTMRPQKMDILSLRMNSYFTADIFTTREGEIIHVIHSEKHLFLLREKEWTSLGTYVEHARAHLIGKTQTDYLFLCYEGKPLVHK